MTNPTNTGAESKHTRGRCRRHEPEIANAFRRLVRCKSCGMEGSLSNGQRTFGRPRRIIWHRSAHAAALAKADGRSNG